jgi:hypothetical protein
MTILLLHYESKLNLYFHAEIRRTSVSPKVQLRLEMWKSKSQIILPMFSTVLELLWAKIVFQ